MRNLLLGWLMLAVLLLVGCGGGGGGGGTSSSVSMPVSWPERSRAVGAPSSALSVVLTVTQGATDGQNLVIQGNRSANASAHTETYTSTQKAKKGTFGYVLRFYNDENAQGTVVATASGNLEISGSTQFPTVTLDKKVATVTVAINQEIRVGHTAELLVEARDSENNLVAISPGSFTWTIQSGSQHLTLNNGVFSGVSAGPATVVATADGIQSQPVTVNVSVQTQVSLDAGMNVAWAAFQDGDSPWTTVQVPGDGVLHATVTNEAGRYGWAVVNTTSINSTRSTSLIYGTVDEATDLTWHGGPSPTLPTHTISVTVKGLKGHETMIVQSSHSSPNSVHYNHTTNGTATMDMQVLDGNAWVVAWVQGADDTVGPYKMAILRKIPDATTSVTIDLQGPEAFATQAVTFAPSVPRITSLTLHIDADQKEWAGLVLNEKVGINGRTYYVPPANKLGSTDYYSLTAGENLQNAPIRLISKSPFTLDPTMDLTLPTAYTPTFVRSGQNAVVGLPAVSGATDYEIYSSSAQGAYRVFMSSGWHGAGALTFTTPDLTGLEGWNAGNSTPFGTFEIVTARKANVSFRDALRLDTTGAMDGFEKAQRGVVFQDSSLFFQVP